jgi:hypothetical protein
MDAWPAMLRRSARRFFARETGAVDARTHGAYLALSLAFLIVPALLSFNPAQGPAASIGPLSLPPMCLSRELFDTPCPGCQLTRSFILIAHGEFRESLRWHRLGLPLYVFFAYQACYRLYALRRRGAAMPPALLSFQHYFSLAMVILLIANWCLGLFLGSNGS